MSESSDPKAYPGVWRGIEDEKPVDRIVEGSKTIPTAREVARGVLHNILFWNKNVQEDILSGALHADRLAVVAMLRDATLKAWETMVADDWEEVVDTFLSALDSVKERLK